MIFDTPPFIFFVAVGLLVYSRVPKSGRRYVLLGLGLLWYASWQVSWALILLVAAGLNYWGLRRAGRAGRQKRFAALVTLNIVLFLSLKGLPVPPFGSGFFCFLMIACAVDQWRGTIKDSSRVDFPEYLLCVSFFPLLVAGPLTRYQKLSAQLRSLGPVTRQNVADGALIFSYGFVKRGLIAAPLERPVTALLSSMQPGWNQILAAGLLSTFKFYVTLSAYCDMGRGVARCFGITLEPNFRPFYYAKDPNDFWQRWNITLGTWIRDYVTLPAMLRYGRVLSRYAILLLAFLVLGLWHGLDLHWILFGLFNGAVVVTHFTAREGALGRSPKLLRALDVALLGALFVGNGLLQAPDAIAILSSGLANPFSAGVGRFLGDLALNHRLLVICLVGLLVTEYFQERLGELDVFLKAPAWGRQVSAAFLIVWFLQLLHDGVLQEHVQLPPLYFRL